MQKINVKEEEVEKAPLNEQEDEAKAAKRKAKKLLKEQMWQEKKERIK